MEGPSAEEARDSEARPSRAWRSAPRRGLTCLWSLPASPSAMWPWERPGGHCLLKSGARGRGCGGERSAGCGAARPGTATPAAPRRPHLLPGRGPGGVRASRGCLPWPCASHTPPLWRVSRKLHCPRGGRRPSLLTPLASRWGWGLLLAHRGLGTIGTPRRRLRSGVHRHFPGRGSAAVHSPRLVLTLQGKDFSFMYFKKVCLT